MASKWKHVTSLELDNAAWRLTRGIKDSTTHIESYERRLKHERMALNQHKRELKAVQREWVRRNKVKL